MVNKSAAGIFKCMLPWSPSSKILPSHISKGEAPESSEVNEITSRGREEVYESTRRLVRPGDGIDS